MTKNNHNALIVEDNSSDKKLLQGLLRKDKTYTFNIDTASSMRETLPLLKENTYSIILSDLNLGDSKDLDTLKTIRRLAPNSPVIVITGEYDGEQGLSAVSSGAHDFLQKGKFDANLLNKSISYAIERNIVEKNYQKSKESHEKLIETLPIGIINLSAEGVITLANPVIVDMLKTPPSDLISMSIYDLIPSDLEKKVLKKQLQIMQKANNQTYQYNGKRLLNNGESIDVHSVFTGYEDQTNGTIAFTVLMTDITQQIKNDSEKKHLEAQLLQAQKMESIGTLAAGVAHEINTPIQFIGDNTLFIKDSIYNLFLLLKEYENTLKSIETENPTLNLKSFVEHIQEVIEDIDIDFLKDEMPTALTQSMEGVTRVTNIVKAMKDFSHQGSEDMALESINKAIESTIVISKNEWKYCANLTTDLADTLPLTKCHIGEIKQVILNLIVNASHAIQDHYEGSREQGLISIVTTSDDKNITIKVSDDGAGIPENIQGKVFDHFFTTKEVGVGTGQGLSMAYQTITIKHKGNITLESTPGEGTTFTLTIPLIS